MRDRPRTAAALAGLTWLGLAGGCHTVSKARTTAYDSMRALLTSTYNDEHAEAKAADAQKLYDQGQFKAAQAVFSDLADNTRNPPPLAEKARFMEAECLRERGRLPDAAASYHRLLQDFPYGAYRGRSCEQMYAIAYNWLDSGTLKKIEAEQAGTARPWWQEPPALPNFTDNSRPLFDTEGEALQVLDNVQTHDGVGPNADRALFWLGYVNFYRGRFDDADHYFSQLVEFHKDSKLRPVAMDLAIVAKNNATGGPVYDSTKASEALQLIHQAEATMPAYASDPQKMAELGRRKDEVRFQLAQKLIEQGKYYERSNHPASAFFCYDLVTRQHPGTSSAKFAAERMAALGPVRAKIEAENAAGGPSPGAQAKSAWERFWSIGDAPTEPKATRPLGEAPPGSVQPIPFLGTSDDAARNAPNRK